MLYFRHEKFRKYQDKLVEDVVKVIEENSSLLAHAPMGLGKTDAVLSPAISKAVEEGLTVFFLTPKISQHKIALDVVEGLNKKFDLKLNVVDLVGRKYMCIHPSLQSLDHDNFYTMCKKLREDEICRYYDKAVGYSKESSAIASLKVEKFIKNNNIFSHSFVYEYGKKEESCPYELLIKSSLKADIIIADYYHLFIPSVRETFMKKARKKLEKSIIIVDEAHNLPGRVRAHLSKTLNDFMLSRIDKECEYIGFEKIKLSLPFSKWIKEKIANGKERVVSKDEFLDFIERFDSIESMVSLLESIGEQYSKATSKSSYAIRTARFLESWMEERIGEIRIIKRGEKSFSISKRMLDPSYSTAILNDAYSSIIMSGTLLPLEMYKDILGIREALLRAYDSPFPVKNRFMVIAKGFTTRFSKRTEEMYEKYAREIELIYENSPGGVAVFFPSFKVLEGIEKKIKREKLVQKPNMKPTEAYEMIENFKKRKSLLLAVQGGSFSEGVDFNNGEIKVLVVAGLALDEMTIETKALIDYYEEKFGRGMEYGYIYPAITKALQSAGRAIRREKDRAVIVFMDERFSWSNYFKLLPEENYIVTENPSFYVSKFFS